MKRIEKAVEKAFYAGHESDFGESGYRFYTTVSIAAIVRLVERERRRALREAANRLKAGWPFESHHMQKAILALSPQRKAERSKKPAKGRK